MTRLLALALFLPVAAWGQAQRSTLYDERISPVETPFTHYWMAPPNEFVLTGDATVPTKSTESRTFTLTVGVGKDYLPMEATIVCHPNTSIRIQDEKGNVLFKIECP